MPLILRPPTGRLERTVGIVIVGPGSKLKVHAGHVGSPLDGGVVIRKSNELLRSDMAVGQIEIQKRTGLRPNR